MTPFLARPPWHRVARLFSVSFAMAGGPPPPLGAGTTGGYYAPPPPPKRKMSPWAWVGIGCGLFTLLGLGGCFALFTVAKGRIETAMKQPITEQEVAASLGGVPIYPGSQLDKDMTRVIRATFGLVGGLSGGKVTFNSGVYRVPAIAPDKLAAWYATKLKAAGWKTMPRPPAGFNNRQQGITEQSQYAKGDQQVVVQIGSASAMRGGKNGGGGASGDGPKTSGGGSTLILTAVKGAGRVD